MDKSGNNIVIISDEQGVVQGVAAAVAANGMAVSVVDSGPECATALHELGPELVVIELGGPGYDGDTAWRARRALDERWHSEPRVVALSRLSAQETRDRAERIGAELVLHAPFDLEQLVRHVTERSLVLAA